MEKFRETLDILFRKVEVEKLLNFHFSDNFKFDYFFKELFFDGANNSFLHQNPPEKENIYDLIKETELDLTYEKYDKKDNQYNLLVNFSKKVLIEKNYEPVCKYENLLRWQNLTKYLGEEIFTTSFFAFNDYVQNRDRKYFSWSPIIKTDNVRIKKILEQGVAENHFHLKAGSPIFLVSWISLMNNIIERDCDFKKLKTSLVSYSINKSKLDYKKMYDLVKIASYIRVLLFIEACNIKIDIDKTILNLIKDDLKDINLYINDVQSKISSLNLLFKHEQVKQLKTHLDYALTPQIAPNNLNANTLLAGERYLMYSVFKKIYSDKKFFDEFGLLFHVYLLIKSKLRGELLQINDKVGFDNFLEYEGRKEIFIKPNSDYEKAFLFMSVNDSINNQNIVSFETRITPKDDSESLINTINKNNNFISKNIFTYNHIDSLLNNKTEDNKIKDSHFYTLHFIKTLDKKDLNENKTILYSRHHSLREKVKKQALAITKLRESSSPTSNIVLGIDSANKEIGCRPEVFAQAFRYLKEHLPNPKINIIERKEIKNLGLTYHVGEDFLDINDGLRAIDETIKFLHFTQGCRLGHALALGIDVEDYYNYKCRKIYIEKQDLLDNIVWILSRIRKYSLPNSTSLVYELEKKYQRLFTEIYCTNDDLITDKSISKFQKEDYLLKFTHNHNIYYNSWKLRGDNPLYYSSGSFQKKFDVLPLEWNIYSLNKTYPKNKELRNNPLVSRLYYLYHFSLDVRKEGSKIEEFHISQSYIDATKIIQKEMQKEVACKGISIETNPTSNVLISTFKSYDKHPLINFYNLGLTANQEKIESCPQISVSINTDDQGIFNTYLENEYALMALALEKELDENGNKKYNQSMIYQWLDNIRKMGIEQSFKDT